MRFEDYPRIAIIGCPGSGKSTLARQIAAKTGHPVIHLDYERFFPGWVELSREECIAKHSQWIQGERWIIDGCYFRGTMEARFATADLVIYLDLPRMLRLFRVIRRLWQPRPDLRPGVRESPAPLKDHLNMYWSILTKDKKKNAPRILALHEKYPDVQFLHLRSRKAVRELIE